jgi:Concanavalin A-like lectin/glucanases superfamily
MSLVSRLDSNGNFYATGTSFVGLDEIYYTKSNILIAAGGGAGGRAAYGVFGGGGGGAGGLYIGNNICFSPGRSYNVVVGQGGSGFGQNGSNSSLTGIFAVNFYNSYNNSPKLYSNTFIALGGGGGGTNGSVGNDGGSGGGSAASASGGNGSTSNGLQPTSFSGGYGNGGGSAPNGGGSYGGGGGAGSAGSGGGGGGSGIVSYITGTSVTYCVGGSGTNSGTGGVNPITIGTGSDASSSGSVYNGSNGVVIVSYQSSIGPLATGGNITSYTDSNSNIWQLHTFTSNGTLSFYGSANLVYNVSSSGAIKTSGYFDETSLPYGSISFNGTNQYLSIPTNYSLPTANTPFTIEFWVCPIQQLNGTGIISAAYPGSGNIPFAIAGCSSLTGTNTSGSNLCAGFFNGSTWTAINSSSSLTLNVWSHIALVYTGTVATLYLNGTSIGTYTGAWSNAAIQSSLYIGRRWDTAGTINYLPGYISNLRFVAGTAIYTSNFTPPNKQFDDVDYNNFLILNTPNNQYYALDSSKSHFNINLINSPTSSASSPITNTYSTVYTSGLYNGSGSYLQYNSSGAWLSASGDFTLEAWIYINGISYSSGFYNGIIMSTHTDDNVGSGWEFKLQGSSSGYGALTLRNETYGTDYQALYNFNKFQWYHVAISRKSGTLYSYVDGVLQNSQGFPSLSDGSRLNVGYGYSSYPYYWNGYIADAKVTNGESLYNGFTFYPNPTTPLTTDAYTSLLVSMNNNFLFIDATGIHSTINNGVTATTFTPLTPPAFITPKIITSASSKIYKISGKFDEVTTKNNSNATVLLVAGGGAGGFDVGGGGGAGGLIYNNYTLYANSSYVVTIGAGGAATTGYTNNNGNQSTIVNTAIGFSLTAIGGGGGGAFTSGTTTGGTNQGNSGGSGGGDSRGGGGGAGQQPSSASGGYGNNGGVGQDYVGSYLYSGAGGGGAGGAGQNNNEGGQVGGNGGTAFSTNISGTLTWYAGGGGGGGTNGVGLGGGTSNTVMKGGAADGGLRSAGVSANSALVNTGGGGGGPGGPIGGGAGGSGIAIISYPGLQQFNGGTVSTVGSNTVHIFTSSGILQSFTR